MTTTINKGLTLPEKNPQVNKERCWDLKRPLKQREFLNIKNTCYDGQLKLAL